MQSASNKALPRNNQVRTQRRVWLVRPRAACVNNHFPDNVHRNKALHACMDDSSTFIHFKAKGSVSTGEGCRVSAAGGGEVVRYGSGRALVAFSVKALEVCRSRSIDW